MQRPNETVYQIDMNQSNENIQALYEKNRLAKLRYAARREQERFDAPSPIFNILLNTYIKISTLFQKQR
ncbi:MAG: hypothetical protein IKW67_00130 [Alphaproteobacteria bacterium]|nr:hypothetical protein [Alphaproteobacteria bacterium]